MSADELRARAAECYGFAAFAAPEIAEALYTLGNEFESVAAEIEALERHCQAVGPPR